jgi:hypothetical protein
VVLTMDDLSLALSEHGVNVKKPDYCNCFSFTQGSVPETDFARPIGRSWLGDVPGVFAQNGQLGHVVHTRSISYFVEPPMYRLYHLIGGRWPFQSSWTLDSLRCFPTSKLKEKSHVSTSINSRAYLNGRTFPLVRLDQSV